eukprot:4313756-Pleurochrysis_carterae.AAC.4
MRTHSVSLTSLVCPLRCSKLLATNANWRSRAATAVHGIAYYNDDSNAVQYERALMMRGFKMPMLLSPPQLRRVANHFSILRLYSCFTELAKLAFLRLAFIWEDWKQEAIAATAQDVTNNPITLAGDVHDSRADTLFTDGNFTGEPEAVTFTQGGVTPVSQAPSIQQVTNNLRQSVFVP